MEGYSVLMANLAEPLNGENPRGGECKKFDELASAIKFAEGQKDNWYLVHVYKRVKDSHSERIESYQKGLKVTEPSPINSGR